MGPTVPERPEEACLKRGGGAVASLKQGVAETSIYLGNAGASLEQGTHAQTQTGSELMAESDLEPPAAELPEEACHQREGGAASSLHRGGAAANLQSGGAESSLEEACLQREGGAESSLHRGGVAANLPSGGAQSSLQRRGIAASPQQGCGCAEACLQRGAHAAASVQKGSASACHQRVGVAASLEQRGAEASLQQGGGVTAATCRNKEEARSRSVSVSTPPNEGVNIFDKGVDARSSSARIATLSSTEVQAQDCYCPTSGALLNCKCEGIYPRRPVGAVLNSNIKETCPRRREPEPPGRPGGTLEICVVDSVRADSGDLDGLGPVSVAPYPEEGATGAFLNSNDEGICPRRGGAEARGRPGYDLETGVVEAARKGCCDRDGHGLAATVQRGKKKCTYSAQPGVVSSRLETSADQGGVSLARGNVCVNENTSERKEEGNMAVILTSGKNCAKEDASGSEAGHRVVHLACGSVCVSGDAGRYEVDHRAVHLTHGNACADENADGREEIGDEGAKPEEKQGVSTKLIPQTAEVNRGIYETSIQQSVGTQVEAGERLVERLGDAGAAVVRLTESPSFGRNFSTTITARSALTEPAVNYVIRENIEAQASMLKVEDAGGVDNVVSSGPEGKAGSATACTEARQGIAQVGMGLCRS